VARHRRPARDLRIAIDCLPLETKGAMLDGVESSQIIVGAYTDREGGVCPMLAAHRHGGRTSFASFARSWDRYTRAGKGPRRATDRELLTLRTMLRASISLEQRGNAELAQAIADHKAAVARRELEREPARSPSLNGHEQDGRPDTGERDRSRELRRRHGWAWLRLFRRLDDYERALEELERFELERLERAESGERELERV
jgi:hypothetical protein